MLLPGTLRHLPRSRDIRAGLFPFLSPSKGGIVSLRSVVGSASLSAASAAWTSPCPCLQVRGQDLRRRVPRTCPPYFPFRRRRHLQCSLPALRLFLPCRSRCGVRLVHSCGFRIVSFRQLCVFLFPYWQRFFCLLVVVYGFAHSTSQS